MMNNELSTQQITAIMQMKASQFCLLVNNGRNKFPQPVRVGGVTGKTKFYNRVEVLEWVEAWKLRKVKKQSVSVLVKQFLGGKFDSDATKKKYQYKAMASKERKPKTLRISISERSDHEMMNCWKGLI